ncbi:DUF1711 domain [Cordyceps militaris]|uniref:DUF1711 domain n=1 Tax=Cordyceps militaris TaxID=73501 RepID=A0A2H4S9R7_CORMI|nr:DUF1711 domain [Cordyceps militaris]
MAPPTKTSDSRRKSGGKPTLIITLSVPSSILREAIGHDATKPESPATASDQKDSSDAKESPSTPVPAANGSAETASDSNAATPAAEGTPAPSAMGPPIDGRKKGVKRGATATGDGLAKIRGKPGPKKKPRLEDGSIDHAAVRANAAAHKLGPKANQGAINAGLRALDRSGKPCRKWAKGNFNLKSFTGVIWEINRWTAPPKPNGAEADSEATPADSADSSNKENKENGQENNSTAPSNGGGDVEMQSLPSVHASSPAPAPIAAAS